MSKNYSNFIIDELEPEEPERQPNDKTNALEAIYRIRNNVVQKQRILLELEQFLLKHREQVFNFLRSVCDEDTDPKDLLHDVLIRTLDSYGKRLPKDRGEALARLHTIAFHSFVDDKRANIRKRRNLRGGGTQLREAMGWNHPSEADTYRRRMEDKALNLCRLDFNLPGLTDKERSLLCLLFKKGLSLTRVSAISHIPISTLSCRLHSAIGKIKAFLRQDEDGYDFFYPG